MSEPDEETFCRRNENVKLKRVKYCHENDKKKLRDPARDKYRKLSEEEKMKR